MAALIAGLEQRALIVVGVVAQAPAATATRARIAASARARWTAPPCVVFYYPLARAMLSCLTSLFVQGKYSGSGASTCTLCDPGKYSTSSSRTSSCTEPCSAGYYCPAGSSSATQNKCPAGTFSSSGASSCTQCAAGRYGRAATVRTASDCDGPCSAGYYCPAGSSIPTQNLCPAGTYGARAGLSAEPECTVCAAVRVRAC